MRLLFADSEHEKLCHFLDREPVVLRSLHKRRFQCEDPAAAGQSWKMNISRHTSRTIRNQKEWPILAVRVTLDEDRARHGRVQIEPVLCRRLDQDLGQFLCYRLSRHGI